MFNGRRQPSCDGTSRMTRECQVRICERLGVKFPGPTRHSRHSRHAGVSRCFSGRAGAAHVSKEQHLPDRDIELMVVVQIKARRPHRPGPSQFNRLLPATAA